MKFLNEKSPDVVIRNPGNHEKGHWLVPANKELAKKSLVKTDKFSAAFEAAKIGGQIVIHMFGQKSRNNGR